ncbi:MAG: glycosyltransferase family 2 protein [Clostridia bacterium]|nr:glycosyltransferase family 2 protein [Clostridia bacterium]
MEGIKIKTLIIVPAYNEALNIEKTVKDITKNTEYDYVVINDCSKDNTKEVCEKNNFNMISLPINYGLTSAIQVGMKYAKQNGYDIAIQFDGDGQHNAKYLKNLVKEIEKNDVDVAIGSRFVEEKKPFSARMLGSRVISLAIKLTTWKKITDPTSGMRAYNKKAIEMFNTNASLTPEPDTIVFMIKKGLKVKEVQVNMRDREFGESYLNAFKSVKYMMNMMLSIIFIRSFTRKDK